MTIAVRDRWLWPEGDEKLWLVARDYTILDMAMEYVSERRSVIQAGGACGTFPHWLSSRFQTVYTFEPDPENFTCLAANCQRLNVIKFQCALGPDSRLVAMERPQPDNAGTSFISNGATTRMIAGDMIDIHDVDLIQLDVEGFEYGALHGLRQTFRRSSPVIVIEQKHSERYGHTAQTVASFLGSEGYEQVGKYARDVIFKRVS